VLGSPTRLPEFREELQAGRDYSTQSIDLINAIRPRLLDRYRRLSDDDLLAQGIVLVARKPKPSRLVATK